MSESAGVLREMSGEDFVAFLLEDSDSPGFPFAAALELTERCCLRCVHCYMGQTNLAQGDIMPLETARRVIDRLSELGVLTLVLTGGEPLLHPAFRQIYSYAHRQGLLLAVATNGTLLDEDIVSFLVKQPPRRLELSVLGRTRETYERVTGVPGSFDRSCEGIARARSAGIHVVLKYPVLRQNAHELEATRLWADSLGCAFRSDALVVPTLAGSPGNLSSRLSPPEAAALGNAGPDCSLDQDAQRHFRCNAGRTVLHIDARGVANPCGLWRGDGIHVESLTAATWRQHMADLWQGLDRQASDCPVCEHRTVCRACPALSRLEDASYGKRLPYYCEIAESSVNRVADVT